MEQTGPTVDQCPNKDQRIKLLSWNIDGLDDDDIVLRTLAVCDIINEHEPDVVFLQEVTGRTLALIQKNCRRYDIIWHQQVEYFVAMLTKKTSVKQLTGKKVSLFPNTKMGRFLLINDVAIYDQPICLITSHLESTSSFAAERKRQLKQAFDIISKDWAGQIVLFGGDLNLRDNELKAIGGLPPGLQDCWTAAGSPGDARYSWDLSKNDNLTLPGGAKPRCRFDRVYCQSSATTAMCVQTFSFVGCQRLTSCDRFPSDHWGLLIEFKDKTRD